MSDDMQKNDEKNDAAINEPAVSDLTAEPAALTAEPGAEPEKESKKVKAVPRKKARSKAIKTVPSGCAYIKATYNNTIVTLTDRVGNVLASSSAGANGFKGPKKATPFAASIIVKTAVEKAKQHGLKEVVAYIRGVGLGREAAVRALNANGLNVLSIKDITPIPHNGCRRRKPRRV